VSERARKIHCKRREGRGRELERASERANKRESEGTGVGASESRARW